MDSETSGVLNLREGLELDTGSSIYTMIKFIGEGAFGKVALMEDLQTKEKVAVKLLKKSHSEDVEREVAILDSINALGPDLINVVKFHDWLNVAGHDGLVFENLDIHLHEVLRRREWCPLPLHEIRAIATQLLLALDALKGVGILHTDIKTDNIMVISAEDQPLRVKLIDFGNALYTTEATAGMEVQAVLCRAPEIFLGLPFNEAIDMWGMGCVFAFLYLANHLFPSVSHYEVIKGIVELLGMPEKHQLRSGLCSKRYFTDRAPYPQIWRLMTPEEYADANFLPIPKEEDSFEMYSSLDELVETYPDQDPAELEDQRAFVDLLKGMLHMDAGRRITPREALQHPFITQSPLEQHSSVSTQELQGPSETLLVAADTLMDSPQSVCSWKSVGVTGSESSAWEVEDAAGAQGAVDWSADQDLYPGVPQTPSSSGSADLLSAVPLLFVSEEQEDPAERSLTFSQAADTLRASTSPEPLSVSHPPTSSSNSGTSVCQPEDDVAPSPAEAERPSPAPAGRKKKPMKSVRRFFKRIGNFFSCCFRPRVEE